MISVGESGYEIELGGLSVLYCMVDYGFTICFEQNVTIRIEGPFTYRRDEKSWELDPEHQPEGLGPTLTLPRTKGRGGTVDLDGILRLTFDDGTELVVPPDEHYEAWTLSTNDGLLVCCPGGQIAFFGKPDDQR